jgi:hypothetical protein
VKLAEFNEIFSGGIEAAMNHETRLILSDYRAAKIGATLFELFPLPGVFRNVEAAVGSLPRRLKRALVTENEREAFDFIENVFTNRGHLLRSFHDIAAAEKWLLAPDESSRPT